MIFFEGSEQQVSPLYTAAVGLEYRTLPKPVNLAPALVAQRMEGRWFALKPIKLLHTFCESTAAGDEVLLKQ